jgi:hypothetical protein
MVWFTQDSGLIRVWFTQDSGLIRVWFKQGSLYSVLKILFSTSLYLCTKVYGL